MMNGDAPRVEGREEGQASQGAQGILASSDASPPVDTEAEP